MKISLSFLILITYKFGTPKQSFHVVSILNCMSFRINIEKNTLLDIVVLSGFRLSFSAKVIRICVHSNFFPNEVRLNVYGFNFSVVRYFFRYNFAQTKIFGVKIYIASDIQNELRRKFEKIHSKKII
jgi:hypothetical protein